eukprot:3206603-Pyramimonas_sp.AAC.1
MMTPVNLSNATNEYVSRYTYPESSAARTTWSAVRASPDRSGTNAPHRAPSSVGCVGGLGLHQRRRGALRARMSAHASQSGCLG